jgi:hypothetical protein
MATHGKGTFSIASWDEKTWEGKDWKDGQPPMLTHAKIALTFEGDLEASCESQALMAYAEDGAASYVGMQQVAGTLGGHKGTFMMEWSGTYSDNVARVRWTVVPGTATGGLKGLTGEGGYEAGQTMSGIPYTLDYELP